MLAVRAAPTPPDYREEIVSAQIRVLESLAADGRYADVVRSGQRFQDHVEAHPDVGYEIALAWNRLGEHSRAMSAYTQVLASAPTHAAARYDRGELHLASGDDAAAKQDFLAAVAARPSHWAIHFRLAQLAGRARQPSDFDLHLTEALRHGLSFRRILEDPQWRGWLKHPELGPVMRRLIIVYGDDALIEELRDKP